MMEATVASDEKSSSEPVKTLDELKEMARKEADLLQRRLARLEEALGLQPLT